MKQVLHKSSISPSRIFSIELLTEKHFDPIWHAHSEYQLFLVLQGTGTRFIGDNIKSFHPGELVLTGPHLPHVWRSDEKYFSKKSSAICKGIVIYFNESFLGDHIMEKEEMMTLKKLLIRSSRGLIFHGPNKTQVNELMQDLINMSGIRSVIQLLTILQELSNCKEYHFISSLSFENTIKRDETDRLSTVYEYVYQNFRKKITLEDAAKIAYMSPTSFSRYFTMKNNKNFSQFISEVRIKHACKLLAETEEPISHICYECGFNTLSNFNKQFKDIVSLKPGEYKKEFSFINGNC